MTTSDTLYAAVYPGSKIITANGRLRVYERPEDADRALCILGGGRVAGTVVGRTLAEWLDLAETVVIDAPSRALAIGGAS